MDLLALKPGARDWTAQERAYLLPFHENPRGDERKMIIVLVYQDFANVMSDIADAVNKYSTEYQMRVLSADRHPFNYFPPHSFDYDIYQTKTTLAPAIARADIVIWAEECWPERYYSYYCKQTTFRDTMMLGINWEQCPAKKIIWHAGCPFRDNQIFYTERDPHNFAGGLYSPDLLPNNVPLNWPHLPLLGKPFDVEQYPFTTAFSSDIPIIIHSPTNYYCKGTKYVHAAINLLKEKINLPFEYLEIGGPYHEGKSLPMCEAIRQRAQGYIYVDQISPIGGLGMSTFEALSAGLVTICTTQNIADNILPADCPLKQLYFRPACAAQALCKLLTELIIEFHEHKAECEQRAHQARQWVVDNLGPKIYSAYFTAQLKKITTLKADSKK